MPVKSIRISPGGKFMKVMKTNLYKGESVRHKARAEWGLGKIIAVDTCGTIRVLFEGNRELSIAKGSKYLEKVL
jgi:hypothetical protein